MRVTVCTAACCLAVTIIVGAQAQAPAGPDMAPGLSALSITRRPLRHVKTERTISVADFGATADDGKNDLPAVRQALAKALASETAVELVFPKGNYDIDGEPEDHHALSIRNAANLVLNGTGAQIRILNPEMGWLALRDCRNVIVRGFSIDYDPLPFTQTKVVAVDREAATFDVRIMDGFPSLGQEYFQRSQRKWGSLYSRENPRLKKPDAVNWIAPASWQEIRPNVFRIKARHERFLADCEVGDLYMHVARNNPCKIVFMATCADVSIIDVTAYACPSSPFTGNRCTRVSVLDSNVLLKEKRWVSANGDAIHFQRNRIGPWVEGCRFEGIADDIMNIYAMRNPILAVRGKRRLLIRDWQPPTLTPESVGETMYVFNPREGTMVTVATVAAVKKTGEGTVVTTEKDLPDIQPGTDFDADIAFFSSALSRGFVVRDNVLRYGARFGIAVPTRGGLIENNTFELCGGPAINVLNHQRARPEIDMLPGGDLIIRGNTIRDCDFSGVCRTMNNPGAIYVGIHDRHHNMSSWRGVENVLIEDNTVVNWRRAGIHLASATNAIIRGNTIVTRDGDEFPLDEAAPRAAIMVHHASNTIITGNRIVDSRDLEGENGVLVDGETTEAIQRRGNELTRP